MRIAFVGTSAGNAFMNEVLAAISHEVARQGVDTEVVLDRFPEGEDTVYVVVPHEYFAVVPEEQRPRPDQLRSTIALGVEQPGTPWFELVVAHASRLAAAVDISELGVSELRRRGVPAQRLQLGYTELWDHWGRDESLERPVDVMYMGTAHARRVEALAGYGATLWPYQTSFLAQRSGPKPGSRPGVFVGDSKWETLRSAKVLLNIHQQPLPYFEWIRAVETLSNGCVLVSEHSEGTAPLVPGEHFLSGTIDSLALLAERLLRDPDRLRELRLAAYDFLRSDLTMTAGAQVLVDVAEEVARRSVNALRSAEPPVAEPPEPEPRVEPERPVQDQGIPERATLKRLVVRDIELSRKIARLEARLDGIDPDAVELLAQTPAYADAEPRVSVIVSLYDYAEEVTRALGSVAASDFAALEVLVLDDASTDGSVEAVREFFEAHPDLPGLLLRHVVNHGVGPDAKRARASCPGGAAGGARRGQRPLPDGDLEARRGDRREPVCVLRVPDPRSARERRAALSPLPFRVGARQLRDGNFVDALALVRREQLLEIGGYQRLDHGWEDYGSGAAARSWA